MLVARCGSRGKMAWLGPGSRGGGGRQQDTVARLAVPPPCWGHSSQRSQVGSRPCCWQGCRCHLAPSLGRLDLACEVDSTWHQGSLQAQVESSCLTVRGTHGGAAFSSMTRKGQLVPGSQSGQCWLLPQSPALPSCGALWSRSRGLGLHVLAAVPVQDHPGHQAQELTLPLPFSGHHLLRTPWAATEVQGGTGWAGWHAGLFVPWPESCRFHLCPVAGDLKPCKAWLREAGSCQPSLAQLPLPVVSWLVSHFIAPE